MPSQQVSLSGTRTAFARHAAIAATDAESEGPSKKPQPCAQADRTCRSVDELVAPHVQCRRARGWWRLLRSAGGPVLARGERTDRQHGVEPRTHDTNANAGAYLAAGRRLSMFRAREVRPGSSVGRAAD